MSRTLAALASMVLTVSGLVFLLPDCASACTCGFAGSQKERVESGLSHADAVFSGEVVDLEKSPPHTTMMEGTMTTVMGGGNDTVSLRVSEVWKGPDQGTLQVSTPSQGGACGYHFEEGREYLVYAHGKQGLKTHICTETKPLAEADADLAVLGEGERPPGGEVLSDTSGGVSGLAMAGVAGLALAASFLVVMRLVRTG